MRNVLSVKAIALLAMDKTICLLAVTRTLGRHKDCLSDDLRNQVFIQFTEIWRHHYGSKDLDPLRNKNTAYCR